MTLATTASSVPLPTFIQIEPVGQCNLSCVMCPVDLRNDGPGEGRPAFMAFEQFTEIMEQFPALEELHLQGLGEPMMHPRFFDMVSYAACRGVRVGCNSNLTLLSQGRAERCVTSGLRELNVSLDAATAETYESIRKGARFTRVIGNILRVQAARQREGSSTPAVTITTVVMRRNLRELPDVVYLAHCLSIDSVFVQHLGQDFTEGSLPETYVPFRAFVREESLMTMDPALVERCFGEAREAAEEYGIKLRLPRLREADRAVGSGRRCDWPWKAAYITYRGDAVPCCMIATPDRYCFGNVLAQGVERVWNGPPADSFRRRLDSNQPPDICAACAVYRGVF
jgi:radical SAM protein with 4Fe4S-binding SPASM domain